MAVTASDGRASGSATFQFTVSADTAAPTKPSAPSITLVSGKPRLSWSASTDNVGGDGLHRLSLDEAFELKGTGDRADFDDVRTPRRSGDAAHVVLLVARVRCRGQREFAVEFHSG